MPAPEGAAALFTIRGDSVEARFEGSGPMLFELRSDWRSARETVDRLLLRFRDAVGSGALVDTVRCHGALDLLRTKSLTLANAVFVDFELVADAVSEWLQPAGRGGPFLVEVVGTDAEFLPIELLPLLWWQWRDSVDNMAELGHCARVFLGFEAIVRRTMPFEVSQASVLARGRPAVRLFRDARMAGAQREEAYFSSLDAIDYRGAWPLGNESPDDFADRLAFECGNPLTTRGVAGDPPPERIHHFACHFHVNVNDHGESLITLCAEDGGGYNVSVEELQRRFFSARRADRELAAEGPLVFFNACGSSSLSAGGAAWLPAVFLRNGNVAFIGTETRVPDEFAAGFARRFYEVLLTGVPVGRALWEAKCSSLDEDGNPLGLLYTLYGNPDLAIEP